MALVPRLAESGGAYLMVEPRLDGKVAVVTGANNPYGIGAAVAKALAEQGARLFLHYFRQSCQKSPLSDRQSSPADPPGAAFYASQQLKSADEVLQAIRALGAQACAWEADLADPAAIPAMFDQAERTLGPVELLVNNSAYWEGDTFLPSSTPLANRLVELWTDRPRTIAASSFDRMFAVNTRAPALAMAEFARRHIERGARWGRIINVSTAGAECFPSEATYGASKLALESYTRTAAVELGKFGVTANVVALGPVQTGWITPELERQILSTIPLGRLGNPKDVADIVVFLASDRAAWVTGQRIFVGGGHGM